MLDRRPSSDPPWFRWQGVASEQLRRLAELDFNSSSHELPAFATGTWRVDDYVQALPSEPPGPPTPGGAFEAARGLIDRYEFADPSTVRAWFVLGGTPLGRDMLLELRWHLLSIRVGVRVNETFDERRQVGGRPVQVWGWAYRTLEGHVERGQMSYEVWKWLDSGAVEFKIHVVSQFATIDNPVLRLGFRAVGRREQVEFARHCCERMEALVQAADPKSAAVPVELP
jgi:uncharacterized protein (UPF0548 family)